jgi:cell division protease FtsH
MARHMVTRYGMSERTGLATVGESADQIVLPGFERWRGASCSDDTARLVDEEIRRMLDEAHARVRATLSSQRAALERIAKLLLEREVLDHALLQAAIDGAASSGQAAPAEPAVVETQAQAAQVPLPALQQNHRETNEAGRDKESCSG